MRILIVVGGEQMNLFPDFLENPFDHWKYISKAGVPNLWGWFGDILNITSSSCLIRAFLQAGKHVCVEYPMALSYRAALELWDLAAEKGRRTREMRCGQHISIVLHCPASVLVCQDWSSMRSTLSCSRKTLRHWRESWRVKSSRKAPCISQVRGRLSRLSSSVQ